MDGPRTPVEPFSVDLPLFSGPFRLLTELVLAQRMDVCDVPIARVTELFLQRGATMASGWELEEATHFLALCAALVELKVGRLLPRPAPEIDDELLAGSSPDLVYARSLELSAFRALAPELAHRFDHAALMVPRRPSLPPEFAHLYPDVLERVTAEALRDIAVAALTPPADLDLSHVAPIRATIGDAMETVEARLWVRREASFRDLVEDCADRIEVVVRFLALLELHRQGKVELTQSVVFGDIAVRWQPDGGPDPSPPPQTEIDAESRGDGVPPER